jgi:hypothetical protein
MTNFQLGQEVLVYDAESQASLVGAEVCRGSVSRVTGTIVWVTVPAEVAVEPLHFRATTGFQLTCHPRYRIRDAALAELSGRYRAAVVVLERYGLGPHGGLLLIEQLEAVARILDHEPRAWTYGKSETAVECSCGGTYTVPELPAARLAGMAPEEEQAALDAAHAAHIRAVVNGSV